MTKDDIAYLDTPDGQQAVEENLGRDPLKVALDKNLPHAALIASQVKYLQRARRKLPSYYDVRCIIPPLAFEQSSGEEAASMKQWSGGLCIDLTCGLGMDSLAFSRSFDRVISVERDPVLAEVASINFKRLGAANVEVVNASAEDFMATFAAREQKADLIYADPDRRPDAGRKQVRLQDCSPDIITLMPLMSQAARTVSVKLSPLFDVGEARRIFPESRITALSAGGECKEVLIELGEGIKTGTGIAIAGSGRIYFPDPVPMPPQQEFLPPYPYMIIPDVALRKARLTAPYFLEALPGAYVTPGDGYVFSKTDIGRNNEEKGREIFGRVFEITSMQPYNPGKLKKELSRRGIKGADIYLHGFPKGSGEICRELGIREGGTTRLAFTRIGSTLWSIELKELNL